MNIHNSRSNRKVHSARANAIVCQINQIVGFVLGPNGETFNYSDLQAVSAALCFAILDIETECDRRAEAQGQPDEVDFG